MRVKWNRNLDGIHRPMLNLHETAVVTDGNDRNEVNNRITAEDVDLNKNDIKANCDSNGVVNNHVNNHPPADNSSFNKETKCDNLSSSSSISSLTKRGDAKTVTKLSNLLGLLKIRDKRNANSISCGNNANGVIVNESDSNSNYSEALSGSITTRNYNGKRKFSIDSESIVSNDSVGFAADTRRRRRANNLLLRGSLRRSWQQLRDQETLSNSSKYILVKDMHVPSSFYAYPSYSPALIPRRDSDSEVSNLNNDLTNANAAGILTYLEEETFDVDNETGANDTSCDKLLAAKVDLNRKKYIATIEEADVIDEYLSEQTAEVQTRLRRERAALDRSSDEPEMLINDVVNKSDRSYKNINCANNVGNNNSHLFVEDVKQKQSSNEAARFVAEKYESTIEKVREKEENVSEAKDNPREEVHGTLPPKPDQVTFAFNVDKSMRDWQGANNTIPEPLHEIVRHEKFFKNNIDSSVCEDEAKNNNNALTNLLPEDSSCFNDRANVTSEDEPEVLLPHNESVENEEEEEEIIRVTVKKCRVPDIEIANLCITNDIILAGHHASNFTSILSLSDAEPMSFETTSSSDSNVISISNGPVSLDAKPIQGILRNKNKKSADVVDGFNSAAPLSVLQGYAPKKVHFAENSIQHCNTSRYRNRLYKPRHNNHNHNNGTIRTNL